MRISIILITSLLLSFSAFAQKKGVKIDVSLTAGSFQITSSKVKGKITKKGDMGFAKKLTIKIESLKSGIDLRDEHLHKRLMYGKYPDTKGKAIKEIVITDAKGKGGKGIGMITIRGITKKFSFTYKEEGKYAIASFPLSLKDFKVPELRYLGIGVEDVIKITATVPIKK